MQEEDFSQVNPDIEGIYASRRWFVDEDALERIIQQAIIAAIGYLRIQIEDDGERVEVWDNESCVTVMSASLADLEADRQKRIAALDE